MKERGEVTASSQYAADLLNQNLLGPLSQVIRFLSTDHPLDWSKTLSLEINHKIVGLVCGQLLADPRNEPVDAHNLPPIFLEGRFREYEDRCKAGEWRSELIRLYRRGERSRTYLLVFRGNQEEDGEDSIKSALLIKTIALFWVIGKKT